MTPVLSSRCCDDISTSFVVLLVAIFCASASLLLAEKADPNPLDELDHHNRECGHDSSCYDEITCVGHYDISFPHHIPWPEEDLIGQLVLLQKRLMNQLSTRNRSINRTPITSHSFGTHSGTNGCLQRIIMKVSKRKITDVMTTMMAKIQ